MVVTRSRRDGAARIVSFKAERIAHNTDHAVMAAIAACIDGEFGRLVTARAIQPKLPCPRKLLLPLIFFGPEIRENGSFRSLSPRGLQSYFVSEEIGIRFG